MQRIRLLAIVASLGASAVALTGCTAEATPVATPTVSEGPAPTGDRALRIGTVFSSSGADAATGAAQVAGVEVAVREIDEAGGVLGAPALVFHRDGGDESTQKLEESIADLSARGVDVIIGPSTSVLAQRAIATSAGVPVIATGDVAEPAAGLFTTLASAQARTAAVAEALVDADRSKVAIVSSDDDAGDSAVASLGSALEADGASVIASEKSTGAQKQVEAVAEKIAAAKPEAVVIATAPDSAPAVASALLDAGIAGDTLWTTVPVDFAALAPGLADGVRGIVDDSGADDVFFRRVMVADPAVTDLGLASQAYDATIIAALAAIVADDDGSASIAASLADVTAGGIPCSSFGECLEVLKTERDIDYQGRSGPIALDASGRPTAGRFTVVEY